MALGVLPAELFLYVLNFLDHDDLARLAAVSKQYQEVVEPFLWRKLEVHPPFHHETVVHTLLRDEEAALKRPYEIIQTSKQDDKRFRRHMQRLIENNEARAKHLGSLVQWLCIPINRTTFDKAVPPWNTIAMFVNLEYLEISAFWQSHDAMSSSAFNRPSYTLAKLHTVKLRGYFPANFVNFLLESTEALKVLELGLLKAPIGGGGSSSNNPPRPDDKDDNPHYPYDDVAPRPLYCLTKASISRLNRLTHLSLIKPSEGPVYEEGGDDSADGKLYVNPESDKKLLREWKALLLASKQTLTHITLDQRVVAAEREVDVTGNNEFMLMFCHHAGYQRFVEEVLPVLLEPGEWPALKAIRLFGFERDGAKDEDVRNWKSVYVIGTDRPGVDMVKQLKERFPGVDVLSELGRRMLFDHHTGEILQGGDVLDCQGGWSRPESEDSSDGETCGFRPFD
jgi:hypothetical protein